MKGDLDEPVAMRGCSSTAMTLCDILLVEAAAGTALLDGGCPSGASSALLSGILGGLPETAQNPRERGIQQESCAKIFIGRMLDSQAEMKSKLKVENVLALSFRFEDERDGS